MAAIDFDLLFDRIGALGRVGYVLDGYQAAVPAEITDIIALYENTPDVDLLSSLLAQRDSILYPVVSPPAQLQALAQSTMIAMVNASEPSITTIGPALIELIRQMKVASESVQVCAVTAPVTALVSNVGNGVLVTTTKRGDGLVQENLVAETLRALCTADSYTGGQVAGQEQFTLTGQTNVAPVWNYDFPQGSQASASVQVVNASQGPSLTSNLLANSDFEDWTTALSTGALNQWTLVTGAWGTDAQQSSTAFLGSKSIQFLPTATLVDLQQTFNSAAGTSVNPNAYYSYICNFWARTVTGTASAGTLVFELIDGLGAVVADGQGTNNTFTLTASTLTTTWSAHNFTFRTPQALPSTLKFRVRVGVALSGASVLVDDLVMTPATAAYTGGFGFAIFAGSVPFATGDGFNVVPTNDRGGATYLATFQSLFNRFYNMTGQGLLLPSSGSPTQPDAKITV